MLQILVENDNFIFFGHIVITSLFYTVNNAVFFGEFTRPHFNCSMF